MVMLSKLQFQSGIQAAMTSQAVLLLARAQHHVARRILRHLYCRTIIAEIVAQVKLTTATQPVDASEITDHIITLIAAAQQQHEYL